jgi:CubicO group peptidase (beta-lactamase class C family)
MTRRAMLTGSAAFALSEGKFDEAVRLISEQTSSGQVTAAVLFVHSGSAVFQRAFGAAKTTGAVFLIASISKPMTAAALMILVDRGQVALADPVQRFIPEFRGDGRERVLVRHLLTHTSGLPDMLPEDQELRKRHAPLSEFVERTCRTPLLFAPGTELRYQSMGILLAAEIAARVAKEPFPLFVRDRVLQPLGMHDTSLGLGGRAISATMPCQVEKASDWDWNSAYWRNLASPWGGALSTVGDLAQFLRYFAHPDRRVLKPETAAAMIADQTAGLNKRWGLGWMLNSGQFGSGCSKRTFGHSGSTGTLCWLDPKKELSFILLTTKPAAQSSKTLLSPVSEAISTAG